MASGAGRRAASRIAAAGLVAALLLAAALLPPAPARAQAPPEAQEQEGQPATEEGLNDLCFICHGKTDLETTLPSGETLPLYVRQATFEASVHGDMECVTCHSEQSAIPHAPLTVRDRREFATRAVRPCEACHEEATKSYFKSIHGVTARLGVNRAATCSDCHTNHDVQHPDAWPNSERALRCQKCHEGADANFASGWLGHREPSPDWFPLVFYAERFLIILAASVLGFGIVHVELELMRWGIDRFWRRR